MISSGDAAPRNNQVPHTLRLLLSFRPIPVRQLTALALAVCLAVCSGHTPASAAGNPAIGAKLFLQCRACHAVAPQAPAGVGPNLYGVVGATAGKRPGYTYSAALSASGIVWTADTLDRWLTEPTALVPGTKMAFAGVAAPKARQNLIAYLESLTTTRVP